MLGMAGRNSLALVGGTVYVDPSQAPVRDCTVVIAGDAIAAVGAGDAISVPPGAEILDCSGLTVLAGFWNSHVHFFERKWAGAAEIPADEVSSQLRMFARYGFTSVFDLSSSVENTIALRNRIESGEIDGPRIYTTGEGLIPPGAAPPDSVLGIMGLMKTPLPEVSDPDGAAAHARMLLEKGADGIKLFASAPPSMPPSALSVNVFETAAREAHRVKRPVFVHPNTTDDIRTALRGGVDVVAHTTPGSGPWDEPFVTEMRHSNVALVPTLKIWSQMLRHDRLSVRQRLVDTAVAQLQSWVQAGGTVLFGTDHGAVDEDPSEEYALMAQAGMTFPQILASLTTAPCERFGAEKCGRIAEGFAADIVALSGDPARSIAALSGVQYTIRRGKIVYRLGRPDGS